MGAFDDFINSAKTFGGTIGDKTKNLALISNKKIKLVESEAKLEKLYAELGKKCFEEYDDDCCDESTNEIIIRIQNILLDIENIKADIELLNKK
jgi:hypothetical protein